MTRTRHPVAVLALAGTLAVAAGSTSARSETVHWKMQAATQAGEIAFAIMKEFTDSIGPLTGGRLEVELLPVGSVVQYSETLDAIGAGILDGQVTAPVYFSGKNPAFALLGDLIAAYNHTDEMFLFLRRGGGDELLRALYAEHGVHYIGGAATGKEALVSTIPIRGVDDLNGIKIRAPEGMAQDIFSKVGAAPVNLPAAEVFTAIERGVVDAADWAVFSMNHQLGFHRIARYPVYPGIHSLPVIDVAVGQEQWNALPADLQAIVKAAVWDFSRDITYRLELRDLDDVAAARADGVEIIDWPIEERARLREIATGIWADWSTRSPEAGVAYAAQIAFLKELGLLSE